MAFKKQDIKSMAKKAVVVKKKAVAKPAVKKVVAKPASKKVVAKPAVKKTHTGKVTCTKSVSGVEYFFVEGKRVSKASLTAEQIKNCTRNVTASKTKAPKAKKTAPKSKKAPKSSTKASPFSNYTIRDSPIMKSAKLSIPPSPKSSSSKVSSNVISKDNVIFLKPSEKYFIWGSKFEREPVYTFSGEEIQAFHMSIANTFSNTGQFPMVLSKAQHNLLKKDQSLAPVFKSAKIPSLLSLVEDESDDEDYEDAEGWSDVEDV